MPALLDRPQLRRTGSPRRARVLFVDDDRDALESFGYLLRHVGYEVLLAGSGEEALEHARAGRFDVLLSDLDMPEMDGAGLLRAVRALPGYGDVPAILMTGQVGSADVARAVASGFDRYIAKPASLTAVQRAIGQLLDRADDGRGESSD